MVKDNILNVRLSTEEMLNLNLFSEIRGMSISDIVRETLRERIVNENPLFLKKREEELKKQLDEIYKQIKISELKEKELLCLSRKEREFLLQSKKIIEKNPLYLEGQIAHYLTLFKKKYKLSIQDYYKLIQEAENGR